MPRPLVFRLGRHLERNRRSRAYRTPISSFAKARRGRAPDQVFPGSSSTRTVPVSQSAPLLFRRRPSFSSGSAKDSDLAVPRSGLLARVTRLPPRIQERLRRQWRPVPHRNADATTTTPCSTSTTAPTAAACDTLRPVDRPVLDRNHQQVLRQSGRRLVPGPRVSRDRLRHDDRLEVPWHARRPLLEPPRDLRARPARSGSTSPTPRHASHSATSSYNVNPRL